MRIEKLADNRVRVTLTAEDLSLMDINIESLTPDSRELHTFLFHMMETIREETDFNPYNGQVVVEATPSKDGISIIVSKIEKEKRITREQFGKIKSIKPKPVKKELEFRMYYFEDFEILCDALLSVQKEALRGSSLYRIGNTYCFMLGNDKKFQPSSYILSEFALRSCRFPMQSEHIIEHWTLVANGSKLADMAEGISALRRE